MPLYFQTILFKLFCYNIFTKRYGDKFHKSLEHLDETQWYSYNELVEYQNIRLNRLIKHAYQTVPYYNHVMNKEKLKPEDIKTIEDLYKMPILKKIDVLKKNLDF